MIIRSALFALAMILVSCQSEQEWIIDGDSYIRFSAEDLVQVDSNSWEIPITVDVMTSGRYIVRPYQMDVDTVEMWLEDYVDNTDDRTYNVTGTMYVFNTFETNPEDVEQVHGSPLGEGQHHMKLHLNRGDIENVFLEFEMIQPHKASEEILTQSMSGEVWAQVWGDEFNEEGLPDTTKWTYDVGDWGWGNNELQYYTVADARNAHVSDGTLKITARRDGDGNWTSARLTTRGKTAFTYGRIEFSAKVPTHRGTWAAGWLLGNEYVDEISWPYCGEIDVLECVGFEIDDSTGQGLNHATCHTRKYYFKQGNQIGAEIAVDSMNTKFHTYAIEWDSTEVRAYLDGEHYYTYDKSADELEWPFNDPQNIIINLAIGGGWGGAQGMSDFDNAVYELDYVRVYERATSIVP